MDKDSTNKKAPPGDESDGARHNAAGVKSAMSFGINDAEHGLPCNPAFAADDMAAYAGADLSLMPLDGKKPRHNHWTTRTFDSKAEVAAAEGKHNLGVQLSADWLVLDADPRRYVDGVDSLGQLAADFGIDLTDFARVRTGSGGWHVYMAKPRSLMVPKDLDKHGYPGLDFKTFGGQVVAPGSIHPNGNAYVGVDMGLLALQSPVPPALVELIERMGSTPILRTLSLRSILDQRSVHVQAQALQP